MLPQTLDTAAERLEPRHTALVVIDMQQDFCAEDGYVERVVGLSTQACREIVAPLMAFVETARKAHVPVIWVRAIYDHDRLPPGILTKQRGKGPDVCCATGSAGAGFFEVTPAPGEAIFDKHTYSAFTGTGLSQWLATRGLRSLVFTGVQTNVCVEASLRDAVCRGFYCTIAKDCVASHSPALHEATLANTAALMGDVLEAAEIAAHWNARGAT